LAAVSRNARPLATTNIAPRNRGKLAANVEGITSKAPVANRLSPHRIVDL
jgi:hypothetical protein